MKKKFNATSIVITAGAYYVGTGPTQKVTFTSKDKSITKREAADSMGDKKKRFIVLRVKKAKKEDYVPLVPTPDKDGKWHLLLLRQSPYIRV